MNCKECGSELLTSDDKEFKRFFSEYVKLCSIAGLLKGGYRVFNYFRSHFSETLWKVHGFYYCPKCETYIISCPNCGHNLQLGKNYPVQGDKYKCPNCEESMIFYYENDDYYIDYSDTGYL